MIRIKQLIERIFTKKNIKIFLSLFVVVGFFVGTSFAQSTQTNLGPVEKVSYILHIFISILSWGWVVLATLAGKLMTNDFVYGTFLHLDKALWDLWNIVKNFANFTLGFVFVFSIVKNLFKGSFSNSKDDPINGAKHVIINTLVAGILVQISWFLFAVLLDLSTIATVAVGSLPSQFMSSDTEFQGNMNTLIRKTQTKIVVDFENNGNIVDMISTGTLNTDDDVKKIIDTITPGSDSMAGPLIFLGASVFNMYDLCDSSRNEGDTDNWGDLFLTLGINGFVVFSFSLMLALVFLFNLFRVITLWVVIPLSPFICILSVFKNDWKSLKLEGFLGDVTNIEKIIKLIFKPVYMTLVLSIVLIVMVLIRSLVKSNNGNLDLQEQNNISINSMQEGSYYNSSMDVGNIAKINMTLKESVVDILVYVLGLILMIILMKSCVSGEITGIKFIDEKMNNFSKMIWGGKGEFGGLLGNMGVIPTGQVDEKGNPIKLGIGNTINARKNNDVFYNKMSKKLGINTYKQDDAMRKRLKINENSSFSELNPSLPKNEWMDKAVLIGKKLGYVTFSDFWAALDKAKSEFERRNTPVRINQGDLSKLWDDFENKTENDTESGDGSSSQ